MLEPRPEKTVKERIIAAKEAFQELSGFIVGIATLGIALTSFYIQFDPADYLTPKAILGALGIFFMQLIALLKKPKEN